jgi:hypothetical protein
VRRYWGWMWLAGGVLLAAAGGHSAAVDSLEEGFRNPPPEARPHTYWLWLNGYVEPEQARAELRAMKDAGFGGVLMFDMGARGGKAQRPPDGPAFLSPPWMKQFKESVQLARELGLQFDFSAISSWDMGGQWIEPRHGSMGLYTSEWAIEGGRAVDVELPFPSVPPAAPKSADGKPVVWEDVAVLAARNAARQPGQEFVWALDPPGIHTVKEAVLDNGEPRAPANLAATLTPVRDFTVAVSATGVRDADFHEVVRGTLPAGPGAQRFPIPAGTRARYVRLCLLSGHDSARPRWTLGEFSLLDTQGKNTMAARVADTRRNGAIVIRNATPLGYDGEWNLDNLNNGSTRGPRGVFASAGLPQFDFAAATELVNVTAKVGRDGRLRWDAPAGKWTILRYVCVNTGERLKVPSPASDGWATDHLNPAATHAHMQYVIGRLKDSFGNLQTSGITNLYLASYEVRGPVWSPVFAAEFRKRRGYDLEPYLPAIFGSRVGGDERTERFLFDYRKTLGEVLVDAYYKAARDDAHAAGLFIKSEAGGPGPPVHNVPVDALLANAAVDSIQGEFWPYWPNADGLWVVKEPASAGHLYNKSPVHLESFTSMENWREGPQDLKPSADRVFCEGGNHFVWHTWTHNAPAAGLPGWGYLAGTHLNRNVTWWPKAKPFLSYLSRGSYLLQRGKFVADVLYYFGDGGYKFIGPRRNEPSLGPGYDYDVANSDVILNRLDVKDGRLVLPDGMSYALLVLPEAEDMHPAVLRKIERMVADGATAIGPKPLRAVGLEGYPASDATVRELAAKLWGDLDGRTKTSRVYGKGRVIWGAKLRDVLAGMKIAPDFTAPPAFDYTHRRDGATDIYFVRNVTAAAARGTLQLRTGREPELWDAVTGQIRDTGYTVRGGVVEVPLELPANGSTFVVCRRPVRPGGMEKTEPVLTATLPVAGDWRVEFEVERGAPAQITLPALTSWTAHSDPGVRYFSGTAKYRTAFTLPAGWRQAGARVELDLGRLWTIGEAWLNGQPLGIAWTAPFTLDCTAAVREGVNELTVEVTNTWANRLIGDAREAGPRRTTRTNVPGSGGKPWQAVEPNESGLFGPVRLLRFGR